MSSQGRIQLYGGTCFGPAPQQDVGLLPRTRAKGMMLRVPNQYWIRQRAGDDVRAAEHLARAVYFDENDLMGLPIPEWFDST